VKKLAKPRGIRRARLPATRTFPKTTASCANFTSPARPTTGTNALSSRREFRISANPRGKEDAELLEWCEPWDPETFDLELANRMLSH